MLRHLHVHAACEQAPPLDERPQRLAVEPGPAAVEPPVPGLHRSLMAVDVREDTVEGCRDPRQLGSGDRHRLDCQRAVGAGAVLPNKAVRLHPSRKGGFGDFPRIDLVLTEGGPPTPFQPVPRTQLTGGNEPPRSFAH